MKTQTLTQRIGIIFHSGVILLVIFGYFINVPVVNLLVVLIVNSIFLFFNLGLIRFGKVGYRNVFSE